MSEQASRPAIQLALPRLPRRRHPIGIFVAMTLPAVCGSVALAEFAGWNWLVIALGIGAGVLILVWELRPKKQVLVALAGRPRSGKSYLLAVSSKAQELPDGRRFRLAPADQETATLTNRYRDVITRGEQLPPNAPTDFRSLRFYVEEDTSRGQGHRWRRRCRLYIWEASGEFLEIITGTRESPLLTRRQLEDLRAYLLRTDLALLLVDGEVADDPARKEATDRFLLNTCDVMAGLLSGRPKRVCHANAVVLLTKADLHPELILDPESPRRFFESYLDRTTRDIIGSRFKAMALLPVSALGMAYAHGTLIPQLAPFNHLAWLSHLRVDPYLWPRRLLVPVLLLTFLVGAASWNAWNADRASNHAQEAVTAGQRVDAVTYASLARSYAERNRLFPDVFRVVNSSIAKLVLQERHCKALLAIANAQSALAAQRFRDATIHIKKAIQLEPTDRQARELLARIRKEWDNSLGDVPLDTVTLLNHLCARLEQFPEDRTIADIYVSQIIEQVLSLPLTARTNNDLAGYIYHIQEVRRYEASGPNTENELANAAQRLGAALLERVQLLLDWPECIKHWPGDSRIQEMISLASSGATLPCNDAPELARRAKVGRALQLVTRGKPSEALALLDTTIDRTILPHRRWVEFLATRCTYEPDLGIYISAPLTIRTARNYAFDPAGTSATSSGAASAIDADALAASLLGQLPTVELARSLQSTGEPQRVVAEWTAESDGASRVAVGRPWWHGEGPTPEIDAIHLPPLFRSRFVRFRCIVRFARHSAEGGPDDNVRTLDRRGCGGSRLIRLRHDPMDAG